MANALRAATACALAPGIAAATARSAPPAPPGRGAVRALDRALLGAPGAASGGRRLVLIELGGANDGLNTLVPWRDDLYRAARPILALGPDELVHPDGARTATGEEAPALNRALAPLLSLLERGELAFVQGLGYPSPNRSHFTSIHLWETGGDGARGAGPDGWITHDLEHRLGRPVADAHGIGLDGTVGPLDSGSGRWLSTRSASSLASLEAPLAARDAASGAGPGAPTLPAVAAMAARMRDVDATLGRLREKVRRGPSVEPVAEGELGAQLTDVVRLVTAGLDTPVYHVRLAGFDTHVNQRGRHARLLRELAAGLRGLRRALVEAGEWDRTLVATYSEFGRRAAENGSGGTDHGTAAPHLVAGGALGSLAPFHGRAPDLGALDETGDPAPTLDYRALYERVLSGWFGIRDNRFADFRAPALEGLLRPG